ncbi:MAG: class I SAM-dependent methyltransferase [Gemmatimonadota bacterium]
MNEDFDAKALTWDDDPARIDRAAVVAQRIMEAVPLDRDMDILEFGSGTGLLGFELLPHVSSVTFADTSDGMLDRVREKLRAGRHPQGRVLRLDPDTPRLPRRYDAIVSLLTLHHIPEITPAIRLLADHLTPGGWLALCDLDTENGSFHEDPAANVHHGFDRKELLAVLDQAGLTEGRAETAYTIRTEQAGPAREYTLFLITARRTDPRGHPWGNGRPSVGQLPT